MEDSTFGLTGMNYEHIKQKHMEWLKIISGMKMYDELQNDKFIGLVQLNVIQWNKRLVQTIIR